MSASGGVAGSTGTPVAASATVANAVNAVSLPAVAGKTNYLTGFEVTGAGATAASVIDVTVTGVGGVTLHYALAIIAGAALGVAALIVEFPVPLQAAAANSAITVSVPAFGAGNTAAAAAIHGYVL